MNMNTDKVLELIAGNFQVINKLVFRPFISQSKIHYGRSDQLDQARSSDRGLVELSRQEWSRWSTLLGIPPTSYSKILDMPKKIE